MTGIRGALSASGFFAHYSRFLLFSSFYKKRKLDWRLEPAQAQAPVTFLLFRRKKGKSAKAFKKLEWRLGALIPNPYHLIPASVASEPQK